MKRLYLLFVNVIMLCTFLAGCATSTTLVIPQEKTIGKIDNTTDSTSKAMKTAQIGATTYFLINSEEDLRSIGGEEYPLSGNYMLNCDISLTKEWVPIGKDDDNPFTGIFEGNGFKIRDVTINDENAEYKYAGFFGLVDGGKLHNITLQNVNINTSEKGNVVMAPKAVVAAAVLDGEMTDCKIES